MALIISHTHLHRHYYTMKPRPSVYDQFCCHAGKFNKHALANYSFLKDDTAIYVYNMGGSLIKKWYMHAPDSY
jgi:hypothetical protein